MGFRWGDVAVRRRASGTIGSTAEGAPTDLIEARNVYVRSGRAVLLPSTTFSIARGEALAIRGANGAGKSTLLKVLAGATSPSSGTVSIGGHRVSRRDARHRRSVAALIGLPPMAPDLSVGDHVRLVATTWFDQSARADAAASEALDSLGISGLAHRFPGQLSTGQLQLAALAFVLVRPFDVLLLDEPEQRLDQDRVRRLGSILAARRDAGASVVFATHDDALERAVANRTLLLRTPR